MIVMMLARRRVPEAFTGFQNTWRTHVRPRT
jgi:hypothetical protein